MAEQFTQAEIEQQTEDLKASIARIAEDAMDVAHGYGAYYEDRPLADHPVWGDAWRSMAWQDRHAGMETGPPVAPYETEERWRTMDRWLTEIHAEPMKHRAETVALPNETPAAHRAFEKQERLARMQQVTQDAAQRAPQQATQEHRISYGR